MLWQKIIGASPPQKPLEFVGVTAAVTSSSAGAAAVFFNSLSGGSGSSAQVGDLVIAVVAMNASSNMNFFAIQEAGSNYISVADLYANNAGSDDANLGVFYKIIDNASDNAVTFTWGVSQSNWTVAAYVWRNPHLTSPLNVVSTTTTSATSGVIDGPSITTTTDGAIVLSIGAAAGASANYTTLTAPSGMTNFSVRQSTPTARAALGFASISRPTAGAYNPPAFGGGFSTTGSSMAAVTMALRPR